MLRKDQFTWSSKSEEAFLKTSMTKAPVLALPNFVLALPNFNETFFIKTNACRVGLGAVLLQNNKPITFLSKALAPKHLGMSTYEKELLAVIFGVDKWRHYLLGGKFVI